MRERPRANRVFPVPGSPRSMKTIPKGFSGFRNSDIAASFVFPATRAVRTEPAGVLVSRQLDRAVVLLDVLVGTGGRDALLHPVGDLFEGAEVLLRGELVGVAEVLLGLAAGRVDVADRPAGGAQAPG